MLLRFGVENVLSIRERQEFNLTASSLKDHEDGLIDCGTASGRQVVPAAVIYGANASGKTNLLRAFRFMEQAVAHSHSRGKPGGGVPREPFVLDPACAGKPSILDIDFVVDNIRYHYGFEATDEAFVSEWLFSFPHSRQRTLFERNGQEFSFGRDLKGRNKVISDLTRPNSLFLSAAAQNDHEELSPLFKFIASVRGNMSVGIPSPHVLASLIARQFDDGIVGFLGGVGTGIVGMQRKEIERSEEDRVFHKAFMAALKSTGQKVPDDDPDQEEAFPVLELAHRGAGGKSVPMEIESESAGTLRLLALLGPIFRALDAGSPIFVDELDSSLHTQACEAVLSLFCSKATNPKGAQLVATTHDTNVLRSPCLRRDQIWFTEKDGEGATHLYPLTDFHVRKDDNLAKGYLQGRFGAVPFAGPVPEFMKAG